MARDPSAREAHDLPLASRIMEQAIREWLTTAAATAQAGIGNPPLSDYERGVSQGIDEMRHLHLDDYSYALVPKVIDQLRRAGLLAQRELDRT